MRVSPLDGDNPGGVSDPARACDGRCNRHCWRLRTAQWRALPYTGGVDAPTLGGVSITCTPTTPTTATTLVSFIAALLLLPALAHADATAGGATPSPGSSSPPTALDRCKSMKRRVRGLCHGHELGLNGFRAPSMGLEYRYSIVSVHAGAYTTIVSKNDRGRNEATWFFKAGATLYFLPISLYRQRPSEFYVSASYVRGFNHDWTDRNGVMAELGWRWMVWRGINIRMGVAVLVGQGARSVKVNPTPGIGYSFAF